MRTCFESQLVRRSSAAIATALLAFGCAGKDTPTGPTVAGPITPISVQRAWPHANGQSFAYRYTSRTAPTPVPQVFPTAAAVPAVTLEMVAVLLAAPPPFTLLQETTNGYVLTFQDSATSLGGVRGQNLVSAVTAYPIPRPVVPRQSVSGFAPAPPNLLRGGVWRQEASQISLFESGATEPTWIFLEGALADRTPWAAQALPTLSNDLVMRARAYGTVSADIAGFHRDDALDVHYLVDFGVSAITDGGGSLIGYARGFTYGRVIWAEDVGPMYLTERSGLTAGSIPALPALESTLLLETTTPSQKEGAR